MIPCMLNKKKTANGFATLSGGSALSRLAIISDQGVRPGRMDTISSISTAMTEHEIEVLRLWVEQGAPDN